MEGLDRLALLVGLAQLVVSNAIVFDDEAMTEHGGPTELAHEWASELLERVTQDDHLGLCAQLVEEYLRSVEWFEARDDVFDQRHRQAVLLENVQAVPHQYVVVGFVPGGPCEGFEAGSFSDGDPHLGDEYPFEVERDECLLHRPDSISLTRG